jgi:PAS domain S-box-containing protein
MGKRATAVYESLRRRITSGVLLPGAKLPPQEHLAAEFGVSLVTARQAISRLEEEGLLLSRQGRGTFVQPQESWDSVESQEALRQTLDFLRAIVHGLPDSLYLKNLEGTYLFVNDAFARHHGRPVADILGIDDFALFPHEIALHFRAQDAAVVAEGETLTFEERVPMLGVEEVFSTAKSPYRDRSGAIRAVIGVSRDITLQRRIDQELRESERRYRTLLDLLPEAVTLVSLEGKILLANPRAAEVFGYASAGELVGVDANSFVPEEETERAAAAVQHRERGELPARTYHQYWLQRKDGTRFRAEVVSAAVRRPDGTLEAHYAIIRDLSVQVSDR